MRPCIFLLVFCVVQATLARLPESVVCGAKGSEFWAFHDPSDGKCAVNTSNQDTYYQSATLKWFSGTKLYHTLYDSSNFSANTSTKVTLKFNRIYTKEEEHVLAVTYICLSSFWTIATLVWLFMLRRADVNGMAYDLQLRLAEIPLTKALTMCMKLIKLGYETGPNSPLSRTHYVEVLNYLAIRAHRMVSSRSWLLISKGWRITYTSISDKEAEWIFFLCIMWSTHLLLGGCWVVISLWEECLHRESILQLQLEQIRNQMYLLPHTTPMFWKYQLYRRFRLIVTAYVMFVLMFYFVSPMFTSNVQIFTNEGIDILFYITLGYLFRCRHFCYAIEFQPSVEMIPTIPEFPSPSPTKPAPRGVLAILHPNRYVALACRVDQTEKTS